MNQNKFVLPALALVFFGLGLLFFRHGAAQAPAHAAAHVPAPVDALFAASLPDPAGKTTPLAQWKGKTLLVNFWATWCPPCVQEMPELDALGRELRTKNVQVIGIGIDSPSNIAEFAAAHKIAYPLYVAGMQGTELSKNLGNTKGGLPFSLLIGADGSVRKTYLGRLDFAQVRADLAAAGAK
jgi:thiol-disulfide isomerase/thioredoxin